MFWNVSLVYKSVNCYYLLIGLRRNTFYSKSNQHATGFLRHLAATLLVCVAAHVMNGWSLHRRIEGYEVECLWARLRQFLSHMLTQPEIVVISLPQLKLWYRQDLDGNISIFFLRIVGHVAVVKLNIRSSWEKGSIPLITCSFTGFIISCLFPTLLVYSVVLSIWMSRHRMYAEGRAEGFFREENQSSSRLTQIQSNTILHTGWTRYVRGDLPEGSDHVGWVAAHVING